MAGDVRSQSKKTHNGRNLDAVMTNSEETNRKLLHYVKCHAHSLLTRGQTFDSTTIVLQKAVTGRIVVTSLRRLSQGV